MAKKGTSIVVSANDVQRQVEKLKNEWLEVESMLQIAKREYQSLAES